MAQIMKLFLDWQVISVPSNIEFLLSDQMPNGFDLYCDAAWMHIINKAALSSMDSMTEIILCSKKII